MSNDFPGKPESNALKFYHFCPECRYTFKAVLCPKHERPGIEEEIISGLTGDLGNGEY